MANGKAGMLSVLIIGCGNIAGGFDQGRPAGYRPYTHAGAFRRDGRFDLVASVDPDSAKRAKFMVEWSVPQGFDFVAELAEQGMHFDVVSICSPTPCHAGDLEIAMQLTPRLIFCEKPVTTSLAQTEKLVALCAEEKVLLAVNHNRRWDPEIVRLRADMLAGKWGALRSATAIYNKGILNNGSHMLDLLNLLIGPMDVVRVGEPVADFFPADPTIPAWLVGPGGLPVYLACGHAADYAIFELQLVFSAGVLAMEDGGLFWRERRAVDSETFKGYRMLDAGIRRQGGDDHSMCWAVDNIHRAITLGEPLASTGESALSAQRLCERIRQSALAA